MAEAVTPPGLLGGIEEFEPSAETSPQLVPSVGMAPSEVTPSGLTVWPLPNRGTQGVVGAVAGVWLSKLPSEMPAGGSGTTSTRSTRVTTSDPREPVTVSVTV